MKRRASKKKPRKHQCKHQIREKDPKYITSSEDIVSLAIDDEMDTKLTAEILQQPEEIPPISNQSNTTEIQQISEEIPVIPSDGKYPPFMLDKL